MKSALKSAIDNNVSVSAEPSSIEISGLASDAEKALGDAPSAEKLNIGKVNVGLSDMETLLKDMKTQAAVLEFCSKYRFFIRCSKSDSRFDQGC